jgi:hypothetical protein
MSFVKAAPEMLEAASADLASIRATISAASAFAAAPTMAVPAAGADGVSAAISALFGIHGQAYQQLSAQANEFHDQFVQLLSAGARSYAGVDAANEAALQVNTAFGSAVAAGPTAAPSLAPSAAAAVPASASPGTPIYAALANSPAFEGLGDWLS